MRRRLYFNKLKKSKFPALKSMKIKINLSLNAFSTGKSYLAAFKLQPLISFNLLKLRPFFNCNFMQFWLTNFFLDSTKKFIITGRNFFNFFFFLTLYKKNFIDHFNKKKKCL